MTRVPLLLAPCAAITLISGCGSAGTAPAGFEQRAERAIRDFMSAAARRDGGTACASLDDNGQALMAAYPSPTGSVRTGRSCEDTVNGLDRLPHADEWKLLAHGTVIVTPGAGLDASTVTVSYEAHGRWLKTGASVQPQLGSGDLLVTAPPTPAIVRWPRASGDKTTATR